MGLELQTQWLESDEELVWPWGMTVKRQSCSLSSWTILPNIEEDGVLNTDFLKKKILSLNSKYTMFS